MNERLISCLCGKNYEEKLLKKHIKDCPKFLNTFKLFDFKISNLLDEYLSKKRNIHLVRFMFKEYLKLINKKIKHYFPDFGKNKDKKILIFYLME